MRGTAWIAAAKLTFIVSSSLIQFILPNLLGGPVEWGLLSTAMATLTILSNTLVTASVQTASYVTTHDGSPRKLLALSLSLGLLVGGFVFLVAQPISTFFFNDTRIGPMLQVGALVLFAYAVYATQIGILNGRLRLATQASFDAGFSALRLLSMVGCTVLAARAFGGAAPIDSMIGFALAALIAACVATAVAQHKRATGAANNAEVSALRFFAPIAIYQIFLNTLLQGDVPLMKAVLTNQGIDYAAEQVGLYRVAQAYAMVPYQLILALALALFPAMARASKENDVATARKHVEQAMKFALVFLLALAAPIAGARHGVVQLLHGPQYAASADALLVLAPAQVLFALFVLGATALAGAGQPRNSLLAAGSGVALLLILFAFGFGLAPGVPIVRAGAISLVAVALACAISGYFVWKAFGVFLSAKSVAVAIGIASLAFWVSGATYAALRSGRVATICALALGFATFVIAASLSGLIDLASLRSKKEAAAIQP